MYAQLCKRLSEEAPNFEQPPGPCTFRILLLNKCRAEFENRTHLNDAAAEDGSLTPEEEERRQIAKRKMLGNIKFIGELGKLEILSESILHRCIQQLLVERRSGRHSKDAAEDLECLCQIMRTCGRILDSDKGQKLMDQYFTRMSNLAKSPELPLRIRFMLRDVIELRRDKWIPRKATNAEGPMPMNQIVDDENRSNSGNHRSSGGGGGFNHQELFRRQLKMRGGLDDMLSGGGHVSPFNPPHHIDKFNSYNSNGYQSGFRQSNRQNHHQGGGGGNQQGGQYYQQNRAYNNNQHNNNNNSNNNATGGGGGKEVPPRFMRKMTAQLSTTNLEEVSLRPSANSMLFKPHNTKPMLPMQSGRPTSLVSESMLSAPPLKPSPPIQTKDPPILIKQATIEKGKTNKKEKGPSKEEVLKKILSLTDELLTSHNAQDALSAFKEQKVPERLVPEALLTVLTQTFDKTDAERDLAVTFISSLKKEGLVTGAQFTESFRQLVNGMADRVSTVPRIYSFVAAFASQSVTEGLLTLAEVAEHTDGGNHYPLLMLTLQHLNKVVGKVKLLQLFNDSKVSLLNTLPECERTKERLCEALDDRSLGYLSPLLRIQAELWKQMLADPNPTQLYKWVKDNLEIAHHTDPGFINALVTVLIKYITQESTLGEGSGNVADKILHDKEKSLLEKFKPVLQAFLHEQIELQVTAVYTLQVFCNQLEFPKGMLLRWFLYFYDLEVIEEEAFLKWREEVNEVYPGKGKALFQVNQWLTWLAEAESEEEDDGD